MANLSNEHEEEISLFPMFNILACTLGVMVFILATVATVSLGADKAVEIIAVVDPDDPEPRTPIWLEWDGRELGVVPGGEAVTFESDLRDFRSWEATYAFISSTLGGSRLGSLIAEVGLDPGNRYIVLLTRPSGFHNLLEVRSYFEFLGIDVGYEPIDQGWQRVGIGDVP